MITNNMVVFAKDSMDFCFINNGTISCFNAGFFNHEVVDGEDNQIIPIYTLCKTLQSAHPIQTCQELFNGEMVIFSQIGE